ncbi:class F sortase [Actinomadura montaniterrae]|uniref:Class F sortase n=1 Tax=Actinomadura montaniterrae TaxID=1803903 RepID=A0A6L3VRW5_9ACTN|nr:class F sortase [Actinomadura montaniterrae]KAB2370374.1 class F sortase [Actinomadura montaniterrae]
MSKARRSGRPMHLWYWLAAVLIATGTAMCVVGFRLTGPDAPPQPPSSNLVEKAPDDTAPNPEQALSPSLPERVRIPSIKVDAPVIRVATKPDGELEVPPLSRVDQVGWYQEGPTPGENGRSVLVGHVDSRTRPGVFYRLGALRPGRRIEVVRKDGTVPAFRIDRIQRVDKDKFPTGSVYGREGGPELRLITCGGRFDHARGHYVDNIIVYASLVPGSQNTAQKAHTER